MGYDNTNKGMLKANSDKESHKHPSHRGIIDIEGTKFFLSSWVKKNNDGSQYFSLIAQEKGKFSKINAGLLERNLNKRNEDSPGFVGQIIIYEKLYELSAWVKEKKDKSEKYFSINAKAKDVHDLPTDFKANNKDINDDIPF